MSIRTLIRGLYRNSIHLRYKPDTNYDTNYDTPRHTQIHIKIHEAQCISLRYKLKIVSHLGYKILRSTGRELYRCVYLACIVRICAEFCSLPIRQNTPRYTPDTPQIRLWGKSTPIHGENGTPSICFIRVCVIN